jgi:glycerol-3-phosphate dehydrogenase
VLFVIPWGRHWIIGTTDTDWALDKAHPAATSADIDYLLGHVNRILRTELTQADVEGVYAGLRPLLSGESEQTSKLSREHVVAHPTPGLVVVAGGKYTTYRIMAKDAIDEAARGLGGDVAPSATEDIPMVGAVGYPAMWNRRKALAASPGCTSSGSRRCSCATACSPPRSSSWSPATASLGGRCPAARTTSRPRSCMPPRTRAPCTWTTSWPGAPGCPSSPSTGPSPRSRPAAELVAPVLGWNAAAVEEEVRNYAARVAAERASQTMPDDESADRARLQAPDKG